MTPSGAYMKLVTGKHEPIGYFAERVHHVLQVVEPSLRAMQPIQAVRFALIDRTEREPRLEQAMRAVRMSLCADACPNRKWLRDRLISQAERLVAS
jgi:hypothetical protein